MRTILLSLLLSVSSTAAAQSTLVISCDCPGFTLSVDGEQKYQMTTSGRVEGLAAGRHMVKCDVWTSPFSHSVWYDGPVDLPANTEVRGRVVRGRGLELYGQSAVAPPPPPPPPPPAYDTRRDERWIRRLRDAIGDALAGARDESRECRRTVLRDLEDADDALARRGDVRGAARILRGSDRDIDLCQRPTQRDLRRVLDLIADLREDRAEERAERRRPPRVECWNNSDPGCVNTKNGQPPMTGAAFAGLQSAINSVPNVFTKLDTLRTMVGSAYLTSMQATLLVRLLKPHVFQQLDAVKVIAPRLVDPQNGGGIAAELAPHSFQVQDAAKIISAQRGD